MDIWNIKQNIHSCIDFQLNYLQTDNKHKIGMYWNIVAFKNAFGGYILFD